MKKLFQFPVPVWSALLVILFIGAGMLSYFVYARPSVVNYTLSLPSTDEKDSVLLSYGEKTSLSNPDFFKKIKEEMIFQNTSFIEANLTEMKLTVYTDGKAVADFPILTKGRVGSWWETPAGLYKIATKEESHFSSFGHVYQPFSMSFQGNFFIHGWPYYPDGTPVASSYSGGCIRLSNESAEAVYKLSSVGMPVLVYKEEFSPDAFVYQPSSPSIGAKNYLVADIKNSFVFMEKSKEEKIPFSQFSQVLGALVATDYINIEKNLTLDSDTYAGVESSRLKLGQTTTPFDLLHLSLRQSDPASLRIFANYLSEKRFVKLMNSKATALGMKNTAFTFSDDSKLVYTTPEDLFYLSKYVYNNRKFVFDISAGRKTNSAYSKSEFADIENQNLFAGNPSFVGGKAITNDDGTKSFFGVFEVTVKESKRPIMIYVGNSENAEGEVLEIINYVNTLYQ